MNKTLFVMLIAVLLIAACRPTPSAPPLPLEGTSWVLTALNGQAPLPDTTITAVFSEGQISGSSGCNSYFGSYTLDGDSLRVGTVGSTMMACLAEGVMEQETAYLEILQAVTEVRLTEGRLEMATADGRTLVFGPPAPPVVTLEETQWLLTTLTEGEAAVSLINGTTITLQFSGDHVGGSAGCNSYGGPYSLEGDTLTLGLLVRTEMFCPGEGVMEQEDRYLDILNSVTHFELEADQLTLRTADGRELIFAASQE